MCTDACKGKKQFAEYFLCICSAKYTRASAPARKMSLFSSIIITIILSYAKIRIYSLRLLYSNLNKKQAFQEKKFLHKSLFKIPL